MNNKFKNIIIIISSICFTILFPIMDNYFLSKLISWYFDAILGFILPYIINYIVGILIFITRNKYFKEIIDLTKYKNITGFSSRENNILDKDDIDDNLYNYIKNSYINYMPFQNQIFEKTNFKISFFGFEPNFIFNLKTVRSFSRSRLNRFEKDKKTGIIYLAFSFKNKVNKKNKEVKKDKMQNHQGFVELCYDYKNKKIINFKYKNNSLERRYNGLFLTI